jgi:hypothetical protein
MADVDCNCVHTCAHCGGKFSGRKKKYCSESCRRARDVLAKERSRRDRGRSTKQSPISHLRGSPIYKRIMLHRAIRKKGRKYQYRPLPEERPIWRAHLARRDAWRRYLKTCERINSPPEPSPYQIMTPEQVSACNSREWKWKYSNDPEFRAREKARLLAKKQRRRYQKKLSDDGTVTGSVIGQRKTCVYCGCRLTPENRTIDHMIPLNHGGMHSASNVTECCLSCNSKKRDAPFYEWLNQLDGPHRLSAEREYTKRQGAHPRQLTLVPGCHP